MKAKGQGLKAKIEQRMEATRKAGGEKICCTKHFVVCAYCSSNSTTNVYPKSRKQCWWYKDGTTNPLHC